MPTSEIQNFSNLFADLKKFESNCEHDKSLKIVNKILEHNPQHSKAIHCKIVCLIQLGEFEEALNYLEAQNEELRAQLKLEEAYCLYRLNNIESSLDCLNEKDLPNELGIKELKAQTLYRIENFEECYSAYIELIKNSDDYYEDERFVNLAAVIVGLKSLNSKFKHDLSNISDSTYEVLYNKACTLIATKNYETAIKKLEETEVMGRKFLEEDGASEDEIVAELAIIRAQMAFCMQKLNKNDIALKFYNQILKQKISDPALIAVVSNNIIAIHRDQNLFDSKKKIKMVLSANAEPKLSSNQKRNVHYNYCLFLINTNQYEACRKHLPKFRSLFSNFQSDAILIESYLHIKEKNSIEAIKILKDYCFSRKTDKSDLEVILLLIQLLFKENDYESSIKVLESLSETKYNLAIFSLLFKLYEKHSKFDSLEKLIEDCLKWHEDHQSSKTKLISLYNEAAKFYLNQNKPQLSVKYLEKIIKLKGKNPKIISMLINAYSLFNVQMAQNLQKELPSIEQILNSVDIEQLENKNWSLGVKYVKKIKDTPKSSTNKKKKNKRKKILGKNYDPNVQPDPERWLPKYERSNYRKKKDKKTVGKGTQGAIGDLPEVKVSPKQVASPVGPRQQRPTQKKKKKVGRK